MRVSPWHAPSEDGSARSTSLATASQAGSMTAYSPGVTASVTAALSRAVLGSAG